MTILQNGDHVFIGDIVDIRTINSHVKIVKFVEVSSYLAIMYIN